MAHAYTHIILNQDLTNRLGILRRLAPTTRATARPPQRPGSSKPYSIGEVDLKERLAAELGIRVLLLEADHNDPRAWSSAQGENRITAFIESFA